MAQRMLTFVKVAKQTPEKRDAGARIGDFDEIYKTFVTAKAAEQASRCSQCGVPFCQVHCPVQNNIPDWLKLVAEGRLEEAYEVSAATNNMPEVCGRICPQDRLCEGNCVIEQSGHGTVTIGAVEAYITDTAWANGWVKPISPRIERGQSVGIVGAGPAGLAAAEELRRKGYEVHVYDRYDRVGGLLIYGIPNFKMSKEILEGKLQALRDMGVRFVNNTRIGKDVSLQELHDRDGFDAIFIGTGAGVGNQLRLEGEELTNVYQATDFLVRGNLRPEELPEGQRERPHIGTDVVVVGGGATGWNAPASAPWFAQALDAASQAHFGAPCGYIGQGGTIPLMNQLSEGFPTAQMMVCGVLGPRSNAHGPNEFLHVPYAKRLTAAVSDVIARMP